MNKHTIIMKKALSKDWGRLPVALKKHYLEDKKGINVAHGYLDIDFPIWMKLPIKIIKIFGALVDKKGENIPTIIRRENNNDAQLWHRTISYTDKKIYFNSKFVYEKNNQVIEYVNRFMGVRMSVRTADEVLYYKGINYVLKIGNVLIPIHNSLMLGEVNIQEKAIDNDSFFMDFYLQHSIFGKIFSYKGEFKTTTLIQPETLTNDFIQK